MMSNSPPLPVEATPRCLYGFGGSQSRFSNKLRKRYKEKIEATKQGDGVDGQGSRTGQGARLNISLVVDDKPLNCENSDIEQALDKMHFSRREETSQMPSLVTNVQDATSGFEKATGRPAIVDIPNI